MRLARRLARSLGLPRNLNAARRTATLKRKGKVRVTLKLTRRVRRQLRKVRRATFVLRVRAQDPAGNRRTLTRTRRVNR